MCERPTYQYACGHSGAGDRSERRCAARSQWSEVVRKRCLEMLKATTTIKVCHCCAACRTSPAERPAHVREGLGQGRNETQRRSLKRKKVPIAFRFKRKQRRKHGLRLKGSAEASLKEEGATKHNAPVIGGNLAEPTAVANHGIDAEPPAVEQSSPDEHRVFRRKRCSESRRDRPPRVVEEPEATESAHRGRQQSSSSIERPHDYLSTFQVIVRMTALQLQQKQEMVRLQNMAGAARIVEMMDGSPLAAID